MRVMGWLLVACVVTALIKAVMAMLAIALAILVLWGAINRPGETLAVLGVLMFVAWPPLLIAVVVAAIIRAVVRY